MDINVLICVARSSGVRLQGVGLGVVGLVVCSNGGNVQEGLGVGPRLGGDVDGLLVGNGVNGGN